MSLLCSKIFLLCFLAFPQLSAYYACFYAFQKCAMFLFCVFFYLQECSSCKWRSVMCSRVHRHIRAGFLGHVYSPSEAIHLLLSNTFVVLHANNKCDQACKNRACVHFHNLVLHYFMAMKFSSLIKHFYKIQVTE